MPIGRRSNGPPPIAPGRVDEVVWTEAPGAHALRGRVPDEDRVARCLRAGRAAIRRDELAVEGGDLPVQQERRGLERGHGGGQLLEAAGQIPPVPADEAHAAQRSS